MVYLAAVASVHKGKFNTSKGQNLDTNEYHDQ